MDNCLFSVMRKSTKLHFRIMDYTRSVKIRSFLQSSDAYSIKFGLNFISNQCENIKLPNKLLQTLGNGPSASITSFSISTQIDNRFLSFLLQDVQHVSRQRFPLCSHPHQGQEEPLGARRFYPFGAGRRGNASRTNVPQGGHRVPLEIRSHGHSQDLLLCE